MNTFFSEILFQAKTFDPECCKYINVAKAYSRKVTLGNSVFDLSSINAKIFYDVLITRKILNPILKICGKIKQT